MWTCKVCGMQVEEDHFEACWKCAAPREATDAEVARLRAAWQSSPDAALSRRALACANCRVPLVFASTQRLHEGSRITFFGGLFAQDPEYDTYICPRCGKVEFYIAGFMPLAPDPADAPPVRVPRKRERRS